MDEWPMLGCEIELVRAPLSWDWLIYISVCDLSFDWMALFCFVAN